MGQRRGAGNRIPPVGQIFQKVGELEDQSPEDELFGAALEHDIGIIVRVPFDEGGLTGRIRPDTTFPDGDFRSAYFQGDRKREVFERVKHLKTPKWPFVNLPEPSAGRWGQGLTADKMKECVWVRPDLVARIQFLEWIGARSSETYQVRGTQGRQRSFERG